MLTNHHLSPATSGTPFFLFLSFQSVHDPFQVPEQYKEPFRAILDARRATFLGNNRLLNIV